LKRLIDGTGMPLCVPSDVLLDTGGLGNPTAPQVLPVMPNPPGEIDYQAAVLAFAELKKALSI